MLITYDEMKEERQNLLSKVSEMEAALVIDKNILSKTKELAIEYNNWKRKAKWSLISFIGAVFTVVAMVIPYDQVERYSGNASLVHNWIVALMLAVFSLVYITASGIYLTNNFRKRFDLYNELKKLKKTCEDQISSSRKALHQYCTDIIIQSEVCELLEKEINRRDLCNEVKASRRNEHKKQLGMFIDLIKGVKTALKLSIGNNTPDFDDLEKINVEEPVYSEHNRKLYSLFSEYNSSDDKAQ
jgi:lipid-A-disaccharide synthase-like uncharacterized protein